MSINELLITLGRITRVALNGVIIYAILSLLNPTINLFNSTTFANVKGHILYHAHAGPDKNDGSGFGSGPESKNGMPVLQGRTRNVICSDER